MSELRDLPPLLSGATIAFDLDGTLVDTAPAPLACAVGATVDDCVAAGLGAFAQQMPERAHALSLQMEGQSIEAIGQQIGRSAAATKEFLSQCRKKIQPFIAHCMDLLST